jgi:hypothetical protein
MLSMTECPFCNTLLGRNDFLPVKGAVCPTCGNQVAAGVLAKRPAASTLESAVPGPSSPPVPGGGPGAAGVPAGRTIPGPVVEENDPDTDASLAARLLHLDPITRAALVAGSVALLLASIPSLSLLTTPLAALGLLLGIAASLAAALRRPANLVLPLAVSVLGLLTLLFAGRWPEAAPPPPPQLVAVPLRQKGMVAHRPISDSDWADASADAVQSKDLRVQVTGVRVGVVPLEYQGKKVLSPDKYLVIRVQVSYQGVVFEQLPYTSWADLANSPSGHPPTLTDNRDHTYAQKTFDPARPVVGRGGRSYLSPGRQVNEVLVFPVPHARVEQLRLTLPASAFGRTGAFRFQVPRSMIETS